MTNTIPLPTARPRPVLQACFKLTQSRVFTGFVLFVILLSAVLEAMQSPQAAAPACLALTRAPEAESATLPACPPRERL